MIIFAQSNKFIRPARLECKPTIDDEGCDERFSTPKKDLSTHFSYASCFIIKYFLQLGFTRLGNMCVRSILGSERIGGYFEDKGEYAGGSEAI